MNEWFSGRVFAVSFVDMAHWLYDIVHLRHVKRTWKYKINRKGGWLKVSWYKPFDMNMCSPSALGARRSLGSLSVQWVCEGIIWLVRSVHCCCDFCTTFPLLFDQAIKTTSSCVYFCKICSVCRNIFSTEIECGWREHHMETFNESRQCLTAVEQIQSWYCWVCMLNFLYVKSHISS